MEMQRKSVAKFWQMNCWPNKVLYEERDSVMRASSEKPIRILHVLTAMDRAGTETMLMNLYRAVDRNKIQFDFAVSAKKSCDYDDEIVELGGIIFHYPKYTGKNHFTYKKWWKRFFEDHPEYQIIHGHIGSTAAIYLQIAKRKGLFTIAHSHSTGGHTGVHDYLYKIYSFRTRFIADYFFGCSTEALISRYGKKIASDNRRTHILNNGIDVAKYSIDKKVCEDVRRELRIDQNILVVGTVGRFTEAKNPFFIVDIIDELVKKKAEFVFLWVGTGELLPQIKNYIIQKNLQDYVLLLGVRNDVNRILQALNVFILPSTFEGLPVIGVEVQAAGVPMLCSDKVSKEVDMTKCVKFLSIESANTWRDEILKEKEYRRLMDAPKSIVEHGYDVSSTAEWLTNFYLKNQRYSTED